MKDILHDIDAWTARGDKVAIAMVVSVKRSAPGRPGRRWRSARAARSPAP